MDIKGQKMLKVCGILMIIFGALALVLALLIVIGGGFTSTLSGFVDDTETAVGVAAVGGIVMIIGIIGCISAALEMATGIVGVKAAGMPSVGKIKAALILDLIVIILTLVSIVYELVTGGYAYQAVYMTIISIVASLVVPVLFLVGVIQYKNGLLELMGGAE